MPTLSEIDSFDPTEWVHAYAKPAFRIDNEIFDQILKFSLIWSLFERDACSRNAGMTSIQKSVKDALHAGVVSTDLFKSHIDFFRDRAKIHHDSIEGYIAALRTSNAKTDLLLRDFFSETNQSPVTTLTALLVIAYRIRNNLFHGEKEVADLHTQSELFKVINSMLATYLTRIKMLLNPPTNRNCNSPLRGLPQSDY